MVLHTLSGSPESSAFADCLRLISPGDALLLMGDGVYCGLAATVPYEALHNCGAALYVLETDAMAAGVLERIGDITVIDIEEFVGLSEEFPRQLAWY